MPPRSAKMKRRILGFQRRVWWPKWTPASSSSFMETTAMSSTFLGLGTYRRRTRAEPGTRPRHRRPGGVAGSGTVAGMVAGNRAPLGARSVERGREIRRQRRAHVDLRAREGVLEAEAVRMEELPSQSDIAAHAVHRIAGYR